MAKRRSFGQRLAADIRKREILDATLRLLSRDGLQGFSLEAVAREAKVAATLPRHYFGGKDRLLKAATEDLISQVEHALFHEATPASLEARFSAYLDVLEPNQWGHDIWLRGAQIHPELGSVVRDARHRVIEAMFRRPWKSLSQREQLDGLGRVGYIEAVVADWLEQHLDNRELVIKSLMRAAIPSTISRPDNR